jgi:hypothetical protein
MSMLELEPRVEVETEEAPKTSHTLVLQIAGGVVIGNIVTGIIAAIVFALLHSLQ